MIQGAPDWLTTIGTAARLSPSQELNPPAHCYPSAVQTEPDSPGLSRVSITWTALVPTDERGYLDALDVLADMRAALVSSSLMGSCRESGSSVEPRDDGSAYAVVSLTISQSVPTCGRFAG